MQKTCKLIVIVLTIIFAVSVFSVAAQDEVKFPGKIGVEYKLKLYSDIMDSHGEESVYGDSGDIYLRHEFKGKIKFKVTDFYSITPWLKDRLDMKMYYDSSTKDEKQVDMKLRNRFYIGLDNTFSIPDIMDIGINFELRLANRLDKDTDAAGKQGIPVDNTGFDPTHGDYSYLYVRTTPSLSLSGDYDFGLSWSMNNLFEFNMIPGKYDPHESDIHVQSFGYELDTLSVGFEFFHFFAPKKMKCTFQVDFYMLTDSKIGTNRYETIEPGKRMDIMDLATLYIGLNFDFWGFKPFIGAFFMFDGYENPDGGFVGDKMGMRRNSNITGVYTDIYSGLKCGIGFKKDFMSLKFTYYGYLIAADTFDNSPNFNYDDVEDDDKLSDAWLRYGNAYHRFWQNSIECEVAFKL